MGKQGLIIFLLLLLVYATSAQQQYRKLNKGWILHNANEQTRYPARVPGSVYSDLFRNGLIPDPYFGDNEQKLQWVAYQTWVYETAFNLSTEELPGKN
jgi:beta-mannosidase